MQYHPVVDSFWTIPALTPSYALVFAGCFAACAYATIRAPRYGLAALVLTIPFDFAHALGATTIGLPKVLLLAVLIGLIARPRAWKALASRDALRVLAGFVAISAAIAFGGIGAEHLDAVAREQLKWLEYTLFFVAAFVAHAADPDDALVRKAMCASIVGVCAYALAQELIGSPWGIAFGTGVVPRIAGAIEGPNQLAGYLETAIAFLGAWNMVRPSRAYAALLTLCGLTLLLTFSRGGAFGALAVLATLFVASRKASVPTLGATLAGATLGAIADFVWSVAARTQAVLHVPHLDADYAGGVGARIELWRAAFAMWRAHPVLGVGAGNYELELAQYGLPGVRTHANSWYLQNLAEGGIVGLATTLVFLAMLLTTLASRARHSPWALGALAATIGLALHQVVDYLVFYPKDAEPWIVLIALAVATARSPQPAPCD